MNTTHCSECQCLKPDYDPSTDTAPEGLTEPGIQTLSIPPFDLQWVTILNSILADPCWYGLFNFMLADGYCDDYTNSEVCGWDGGDCCGKNVSTTFCVECKCLDPEVAA